jgi:hypothetical protein
MLEKDKATILEVRTMFVRKSIQRKTSSGHVDLCRIIAADKASKDWSVESSDSSGSKEPD